MVRSLKSVRHLLQDKPTLKRLERELDAQQSLLRDVRQCLPADLAPHCLSAHLRDQLMVLHTDSPAWATRLRYVAPQLISVLRPEYPALSNVIVRLMVIPSGPARPRPTARHSDRAAEIIHNSACHAKPGPLKDALRRLSDAVMSRGRGSRVKT